MNEAKWKQISPADQAAINKLSGEALARRAGKAWDATDARGEKAMRDASIPIVTASPQFVAEIKSRTAGLEKAWIDKAKAKGVDGAAALAARRARRDSADRAIAARRAAETARRGIRAAAASRVTEAAAGGSMSNGADLLGQFDRVVAPALGAHRGASCCSRMMMLTCVDVIGRYFFSQPIFGAFEITEMLLAALIFAGLPLVTLRNEHVTVDVLDPITPDWLFRMQHVVACALGCVSTGYLAWRLWMRARRHGRRRRNHGAAQVQARLPHLFDEHPDGAHRAWRCSC